MTNPVNVEHPKEVLVTPKENFEVELNERIRIGELLYRLNIYYPTELDQSKKDFETWDNNNCEFLKHSFKNRNNIYFQDYSYRQPYITFSKSYGQSFEEIKDEHKTEINKQISRLKHIRDKIGATENQPVPQTQQQQLSQLLQPAIAPTQLIMPSAVEILEQLFSKFHRIAQTFRNRHGNRETLRITDEYDVQDLMRALLKLDFDDIREEDYVPSYAGSNSRVDFLLKNERIVIEIKMTHNSLKDNRLGNELLIDIARYKSHPDCDVLMLFIYDRDDYLNNKAGIINDLNGMSTPDLMVKTYINPN